MESTDLSWRTLAKRQWPLAAALLFIIVLEVLSFDDPGQRWQIPGVLVVCVIAVLAPRHPFESAILGGGVLVLSSVFLRWMQVAPTPQMFNSGAVMSEVAALMAIVAILVRTATPLLSVIGTAAVIGGIAAAEMIRLSYKFLRWEYEGDAGVYYIGGTTIFVLSVGTGLYFRARDRERTKDVELEVTAAQHAERMALARELHDVVAHYVTAIVVHAQAGQVNRAAAEQVLPIITQSGNEALTAMRRLVGTLRGGEPGGAPAPTSDLVDDVRKLAAESGQPVRLSFDLGDQVPPELGRSVLRLVQESLTNSRKHGADVSEVDVSLSTSDGLVHVLVEDNGNGQSHTPVGGSGGYGLVGMRERVELLGGTFFAGRRSPRGWTVRASLPIA